MPAAYAASTENSRGRRYPETRPFLRSEFQRDRDRVIHSSAFRRLEYKTQVFVNHEGDMFRTRLTHSLEVSQIGRTIARALELDEDLTEAICLAHDLGHTPFGHAGQDILNECMKDHGGFEHNMQSLRVVDRLEEKYAAFPGLNLCFETREGILKHCSRMDAASLGDLGARFLNGTQPGLEAQVANFADEIAYNNHDVDDGLRSGLITVEQLRQCRLFRTHHDATVKQWPGLTSRRLTHEVIRGMINRQVMDLISATLVKIAAHTPRTIDDVRGAGESLVVLSPDMGEMQLELKRFLRANLYRHEYVINMTRKAAVIIRSLFGAYCSAPEQMPEGFREQDAERDQGYGRDVLQRRIADYIAGMTDRFAIAEYERLYGAHDGHARFLDATINHL
ncbi:MAG: deoxyguanosinetriphosphate triphosphohydrolase [Gammaproteobacteria bacterium]|nr:MAG: deoxyguanosinetriphosphate triphosphohydrolase [Gammaproteobacteria bacterium]